MVQISGEFNGNTFNCGCQDDSCKERMVRMQKRLDEYYQYICLQEKRLVEMEKMLLKKDKTLLKMIEKLF